MSWKALEQEDSNLTGTGAERMSKFVPLLDALNAIARDRVAHLNAERLWFNG